MLLAHDFNKQPSTGLDRPLLGDQATLPVVVVNVVLWRLQSATATSHYQTIIILPLLWFESLSLPPSFLVALFFVRCSLFGDRGSVARRGLHIDWFIGLFFILTPALEGRTRHVDSHMLFRTREF